MVLAVLLLLTRFVVPVVAPGAMAFALLMAGWNLTRADRRAAEIRRYARQIEELFAD